MYRPLRGVDSVYFDAHCLNMLYTLSEQPPLAFPLNSLRECMPLARRATRGRRGEK